MSDQGDSATRSGQTVLTAADGHAIRVYARAPPEPAAVLQIFHGLAEHAGRYERFARRAVEHGCAVVAHDHRGHGPGAAEPGHFADANGWERVLADARLVRESVRERYPRLPVILFGHSMGSYLAQGFVMRNPDSVSALILSGSTWPPRSRVRVGRLVARLEMLRAGGRHRSTLLNAMGFGAFNRRFEPRRTGFDWLSRDEDEVDRYLADPYCGAVASARLWHDLLGGMLEIGTDEALARVPAALPILITGGERDPVGGRTGMRQLAAAYERTGHTAVTLRVYEGGRHEMLNETNRDAFTSDVLDWIAQIPATAR